MSKKDQRRSYRIRYLGPALVSWEGEENASDGPKYMQGRCLDVSEGGMRIEVPKPIPTRTPILLRAERINVSGSASVRYVRRSATQYILGLELSQELKRQALASVSEASSRNPRS